jgi:hypothetical protein
MVLVEQCAVEFSVGLVKRRAVQSSLGTVPYGKVMQSRVVFGCGTVKYGEVLLCLGKAVS